MSPKIGNTRLGVDRVKPWNSVRINLGLGLKGPDIRPGLDNRHLIIEGRRGRRRSQKVIKVHGRSLNVMEGQGRS